MDIFKDRHRLTVSMTREGRFWKCKMACSPNIIAAAVETSARRSLNHPPRVVLRSGDAASSRDLIEEMATVRATAASCARHRNSGKLTLSSMRRYPGSNIC
jgi:hypothetical protein